MKQKDMKYKEYENIGKPAAPPWKSDGWLQVNKMKRDLLGHYLKFVDDDSLSTRTRLVENHHTLTLLDVKFNAGIVPIKELSEIRILGRTAFQIRLGQVYGFHISVRT